MAKTTISRHERNLRVYDKWVEAGGRQPFSTDELTHFAIENKLWKRPENSDFKQCRRELARALREKHYVDPQNRSVRALHAVRRTEPDENGKMVQKVFWDNIRTSDRDHMEVSFQQRRDQIVGDCKRLKTDADSFSENRLKDLGQSPIQMDLNFTDDVEDHDQDDEYHPHDEGDD